jgi:hypothetical protein
MNGDRNLLTITARSTGSNTNYSVSESLTSGNGFSPPSYATVKTKHVQLLSPHD